MPMISEADRLFADLAATGVRWDAARWARWLELSDAEKSLTIQMYADSEQGPAPSAWSEVLTVLVAAAEVAGAVAGLAGAVTAVRALIHPA